MIPTKHLREAIELVEERDPLLTELFGMKSKSERLTGVEKKYYDLNNDVAEIKFEDGWTKPEMNKLRRIMDQLAEIKKDNPGIHARVFSSSDALRKRWKTIWARIKKARASAKESKNADRERRQSAEEAVRRERELDAEAKAAAEA